MMNLIDAAQATRGSATGTGAAMVFTGVSTDSRNLAAGELFVALRGVRYDGHDYVEMALKTGAVAVMVDAAWAGNHEELARDLPLVIVADTRRALGELAASWRGRFSLPLIGVTGSNGKTTVKEMCAAILREQARRDGFDPDSSILATVGNLNNDIGMPLMLLRLRSHHRAAVIEMGMNHSGEIDYLSNIARPTVALVNNAQRAHLAGLGGLPAIARAKGEIFAGLADGGVAVINVDDPSSDVWRELAGAHRVVGFGLSESSASHAEVTARYTPRALGCDLELRTPAGTAKLALKVAGRHNAMNALAATAATLAVGVSLDAVAGALSAYAGAKGRLQMRPALAGACLIDDSYNANPDSVCAAIDVLAALPTKKILVLGDMGEVGEAAAQIHDEIGGYAKSMGIDRLLALGDHAATAAHNFGPGGTHFRNVESLLEALTPLIDSTTTVLVKGSRFMKMERVADAIATEPHGGTTARTARKADA